MIRKNLILAITLGDPGGIGSEITAKSINYFYKKKIPIEFIVVGNKNSFLEACNINNLNPSLKNIKEFINIKPDYSTINNFPTLEGGQISYNAICTAVKLYKEKKVNAIVTAPISKHSLHLAKHFYDGHTGLIAKLFNIKNPYLLLSNKRFSTLHVTCHISLKEAIKSINKNKLLEVIMIGFKHMQAIGFKNPRIGVCAINPHSGEGGIFGDEEIKYFDPVIAMLKKNGLKIEGPISSDIIFREAAIFGKYDLVIANYHDQGHIPVKLLYFDQSVNVTLGVPIIRTSVDHGTAFNIAYTGKAKSINMTASILYAVRMCSIISF